MLKIRLQRVGRKHEPTFRLVLTDSKNSTKSGRFNEILGSYDARKTVDLIKTDRVKYWLDKGVQLTGTVHNLFVTHKVFDAKKINVLPKKTFTPPAVVEAAPEAPVVAAVAEVVPEAVAEIAPEVVVEAPVETPTEVEAPIEAPAEAPIETPVEAPAEIAPEVSVDVVPPTEETPVETPVETPSETPAE